MPNSDAQRAFQLISFSDFAIAGDTVTINGVVLTAVANSKTPPLNNQFQIGLSALDSAQNLVDAIQDSSSSSLFNFIEAGRSNTVVSISAVAPGLAGNSIALSETSSVMTLGGATLQGGTEGSALNPFDEAPYRSRLVLSVDTDLAIGTMRDILSEQKTSNNAQFGHFASQSVSFSSYATAGDTLVINGVTFTAVANVSVPSSNQFRIGTSALEVVANLSAAIQASPSASIFNFVNANYSGTILYIFANAIGEAGNSIALSKSSSVITLGGSTLAAGQDAVINTFLSGVNNNGRSKPFAQKLINFLRGMQSGARSAILYSGVANSGAGDALGASQSLTFSGAATAGDTVTINGVVLTAVSNASTPSNNQWRVGTSAATAAANLIAAINASTSNDLSGAVYSSSLLGVATVICNMPGVLGNTIPLSETSSAITLGGATLSGGYGSLPVLSRYKFGKGLGPTTKPGEFASQSISFSDFANAGDTVTINGVVFTAIANSNTPPLNNQFQIGTSALDSATNLTEAIQDSSSSSLFNFVNAGRSNAIVYIAANTAGLAGNSIALSETSSVISLGGSTLAGGVDSTTSGFPRSRLVLSINTNYKLETLQDLATADPSNPHEDLINLMNFLKGLKGGAYSAVINAGVVDSGSQDAVSSFQSVSFSGAATAGDTVTINGVVLTAVSNASTPSNNQWRIGTTSATAAANLAAAINASITVLLSGVVNASSLAGVVTVSSNMPGFIGNNVSIIKTSSAITLGGATLSGGTGKLPPLNSFQYFKSIDSLLGNTPGVGPSPVNLLTAVNYTILAKSGISTVPTSAITGNLGVSPAAATSITGFSLVLDGGGTFSTSSQVTGQVFAADYSAPTPAALTQAVSDMEAAYVNAAGRTSPDFLNLGAGSIGGMTLQPGLYKWTTGVNIATNLTLNGGANDTFIFQSSGVLSMPNASTSIILTGGLKAKNIVWQVISATVAATCTFKGVVLASTTATFGAGSSVEGRLLVQTAATLDSDTIIPPAA